jgi:hypothetical protein
MEQEITGESLANSLNAIILYKKISTIEEKMKSYKERIDRLTVDIPEFCKPKEDRFETFVNRAINDMIRNNTLEECYQKALK